MRRRMHRDCIRRDSTNNKNRGEPNYSPLRSRKTNNYSVGVADVGATKGVELVTSSISVNCALR